MAFMKDPNAGEWFVTAMADIRNRLFTRGSEDFDAVVELCQGHKQLMQSGVGMSTINSLSNYSYVRTSESIIGQHLPS